MGFDPRTGRLLAVGGQLINARESVPQGGTFMWAEDHWQLIAGADLPPRSQASLAIDPVTGRLLLAGGVHDATYRRPASGCTSAPCASVVRVDDRGSLSDAWIYAGGHWDRAGAAGQPGTIAALASVPARSAVLALGSTEHGNTVSSSDTTGTWVLNGGAADGRWAYLTGLPQPTVPGDVTMAADSAHNTVLAYAGEQPFQSGSGLDVPSTRGDHATWALTDNHWTLLRPSPDAPDAGGRLVAAPDGHVVLVNDRGQIYLWTGAGWRFTASGLPTGQGPPLVATDPADGMVLALYGDRTCLLSTARFHCFATVPDLGSVRR